jgi:hypothetical protein
MPINYTTLTTLVADCYEELDMDKKVQILYKINSLLPEPYRIKIPSLITNDYVDIALYRIEENIRSRNRTRAYTSKLHKKTYFLILPLPRFILLALFNLKMMY